MFTTGFRRFAECLMHPANATLPSAKPLLRAALSKEPPVKNPSAKNSLPSVFYRALGKVFAECNLCTRQRKVTVTAPVALAHALPNVMSDALGKDFLIFFQNFFAECPARSALGKYFLIFFFVISLPSTRVRALGKEANFFLILYSQTQHIRDIYNICDITNTI